MYFGKLHCTEMVQRTITQTMPHDSPGVYVDDESLTWRCHIEYITAKASKRLYFLKELKRAGLPNNSLKHFYMAAIRPILEYCSVMFGCLGA